MSRYEWKPEAHTQAVVGWDRPMNTFFFQLIDERLIDHPTKDSITIWHGVEFDQFTALDPLLEVLPCELPEGVEDKLRADQKQNPPNAQDLRRRERIAAIKKTLNI